MIYINKLLIISQTEEDKDTTNYLNDDISSGHNLINAIKMKIKLKGEVLSDVDGEAAGYILNNFRMWQDYEEPLFFSLDGYSHLLCQLHYFLFETPYLNKFWHAPKNDLNVLFLNRIYCKNNSIENHHYFLQTLQETFDLIIYSFGTTELMDDDFPENYTDEFCLAVEKQLLTINNGWNKDADVNFYFWGKL